MNRDDFRDHMKKLEKKFDKNPDLKKSMAKHIRALEDIMEANVQVTISFESEFLNDMVERYSEYDYEDNEEFYKKTMTYGEFLEFVNNPDEDTDLKLFIDPIYLKNKNSVNAINNVYVIPSDNKIILVPTDKEKDGK